MEQARNLIVYCDGTTMAGKQGGTNVWSMLGATAGTGTNGNEQRAAYVPGIGTGKFKWWNAFSAVFGWGLKARLIADTSSSA